MTNTFRSLWVAISISQLGSGICSFAFGIWILHTTHSLPYFGIAIFLSSIVSSIISPFAGYLTDVLNRKSIILLCEIVAACIMLTLFGLLKTHHLNITGIFTANFIIAAVSAISMVAYISIIPEIVPLNRHNKANGGIQISTAMSRTIGPMIAGFLMEKASLSIVLLIDMMTFVISILILLTFKLKKIDISQPQKSAHTQTSHIKRFLSGYYFIQANVTLKILLFYTAAICFFGGSYFVLLVPTILSTGNSSSAGLVVCMSGLGSVIGGILVRSGYGNHRPIQGILNTTGIMILTTLGTVLFFSMLGIAFMSFIFSISMAINFGLSQTIYTRHTDSTLIGRVLGFRRFINTLFLSCAYLLTPYLVQHLPFETIISKSITPASNIRAYYAILTLYIIIPALIMFYYKKQLFDNIQVKIKAAVKD